jgi:CBS-domain-containing membrane protein
MFSVVEVMSTELCTLGPDGSLEDARKMMAKRHIRHIPVVEEGDRLVGLVSQRDILAAANSTLLVDPNGRDSDEADVSISSVMVTKVSTVDESASLRGAAMRMEQHKIGCLPVVRGECLVGIITDSDFVGIAINLMEQMEDVEPEDQELL